MVPAGNGGSQVNQLISDDINTLCNSSANYSFELAWYTCTYMFLYTYLSVHASTHEAFMYVRYGTYLCMFEHMSLRYIREMFVLVHV